VVTTLVGEATVARSASAQPQDLRMRDNVFALDRIITKERSMVHVLMGGKALLTVRELSVVTVTEEGGRATVELQSGKVGLAVVRERMKPGDVIEVHTPHAVAAVRGTVLVVEIVPSPAGGELDTNGAFTNVHLLHGKLDVSLRSNPGGAPVRLESLQTVTVTRDVLGKMRPLDLATAGEVTTGLKPNQQAVTAIPEKLQAAVDQRQGVLALATAMELVRGGQSSDSAKARSGKVEQTGIAKVVEGGATLDALAPVAEVGEGAGVLVGGVFGALDYGNLQGYDFHGTWEPTTNHQSNLLTSPTDPTSPRYSDDFVVNQYLERGAPPKDLVVGVPFYERGWTGVAPANHGLYQTSTGPANGTWEAGVDDYKVAKQKLNEGFTRYEDPDAGAAWLFDGTTFWTFDDPAVMAAKAEYVRERNLGGIMFWELSGDTPDGELISAIAGG